MPSTDRKLELKAKTSMAQTASQVAVYAKGLNDTGCKLSLLWRTYLFFWNFFVGSVGVIKIKFNP
jgi:hypothetical protein